LEWSEYELPGYSVRGDDETSYLIDVHTILASIDAKEKNIFKSILVGSEGGRPPSLPGSFSWNQEDYLKIANALSQYVWEESLEDWHLHEANFWISRFENSIGIEYARFVFYKHENDEYTIHEIIIDPLQSKVTVGKNLYHDTGNWKALDFDKIAINDIGQVVMIAERNGGESACLSAKIKCEVGVGLAPYLYQSDKFLSFRLYRYEWGWSVFYQDKKGNNIFDIHIDPYSGDYRINK